MNIWEGVKQLVLKCKKMNVIKSSVCLLQKSSFLLKKAKDKDFMKINKDFIKIFIHQIDNRPNYSFTSSQLCLRSVKWIFFIDQVFEIESCRLGRLLLGRWVGGSVVGWLVVDGRWVGGFNKTGNVTINLFLFIW